MDDITIIYLTLNNMPDKWHEFQMGHLLESIGESPVISISRETMNFGINLIQSEPPSHWNIYKQVLRGALITETPYIGIAEDDTLYTKEHFSEYRPASDTVGYNSSRWSLLAWNPLYTLLNRMCNFAMIAPTELVISALTERMEKHPNGNKYCGEIGKVYVERRLGVAINKSESFQSSIPIVNLCHRGGLSHHKKPGRKKKLGKMKAYDIPYWGKATDIVRYMDG